MSVTSSITPRNEIFSSFFFFNDTATTEIYTLSLHDALPIWLGGPDPTAFDPRSTAAAGRSGSLDDGNYAQDRKSTRLNSSHSQISYAVFCLKKKKKTHYTHDCTHTTPLCTN